jgi:regulator of ribonuclease activity A
MSELPSTPDLCDLHAERVRVLEPIFQSFGGMPRFAGEIATIKCFEDNSRVKERTGEPGQDRVLVIDGGGSLHRALLGDRLARQAADNGWAGIVVYGCVRDVEVLRDLPIGIMALNRCPMRTDRQGHGELDVPVTFAGVTLSPGDYLYVDENGALLTDGALPLEDSSA